MKRNIIGIIFLFFSGVLSLASAGDRHSAYYSAEHDRVFWFVQVSDIHIGASDSGDKVNLTWIVTEAKNIIHPEFIVATGDLTDSTNGGTIPNGPYLSEWTAYRQILTNAAGINENTFFDIPGNHDHYNDRYFSYYLNYGLQGRSTGNTQFSLRKDFPFGAYHVLGVCTAGNDGARFSIWPWDFYGDHAGLDALELAYIENRLKENTDADLTIIFGHHPVVPTGSATDTYLSYGAGELKSLMETYGVSMYSYGHTHAYKKELLPTGNSDGAYYLNISSLGKASSNHYNIIAIDCNGISTIAQTVNTWPAVLITAPADMKWGNSANPYAYTVDCINPMPIRALVFDKSPVIQVQYRIDAAPTWQSMTPVPGNPNLWEAFRGDPMLSAGDHLLEVRATGSSTAAHTITIRSETTACYYLADAVVILQALCGMPTPPEPSFSDPVADGKPGLADVIFILQDISGAR